MTATSTDIRMIDPRPPEAGGPAAEQNPSMRPPDYITPRRSVPLTPEEERVCDMATD
jgi:hypothetical protein